MSNTSGSDVVELIIADHQRFEELLRGLRNIESDRAALRGEFAELLVAHAESEELHVYPLLRKKNAAPADEAEHGEEEHAEINQALLAFLEVDDVTGEEYDEKLEELAEVVNHHTNEEEQTLINDARRNLSATERSQIGELFSDERARQMRTDAGSLKNVRYVVEKTKHKVDS